MVGTNDGIQNEKNITAAYDNMRYRILTEYQKRFIAQLNPLVKDETLIRASKVGGMGYKPDVLIEIEQYKWNISVKKGKANSVHQEKTNLFLYYCMKYLKMTEYEKNCLLYFLYGDGTLDGDSVAEERLDGGELLNTYSKEIKVVQNFLDKNKRNLVERFLVYGKNGQEKNIRADYIYHGDVSQGVWCPLDDYAIDYISNIPNANNVPLAIGPLTLQVWNRNTQAKPELEDRRHSIQIKWGGCYNQLIRINEYCMKMKKEAVLQPQRIVGDNSQGFKNQERLILLLDNHRFSNLDGAVKELVNYVFPTVAQSDYIYANKISGEGIKPKIAIRVNNQIRNLTVFMGGGNSVHQEHIQTFLPYCKESLGMTEQEEIAFKKILYADGTIDGESKSEERLNKDVDIKHRFSSEINFVQEFLDRNKRVLIKRFLIYGKLGEQNNIKTDYIYYGTDATGRCVNVDDVVTYIESKDNAANAILSIGSLSIQTWNRNLSAKPEYEYKRNSIQVKWGGIKSDINIIRELLDNNSKGTVDGDWEEYELVANLNKNKNVSSQLWKSLANNLEISSLENIHAIKVSDPVYSKLADRKVLPKADIYLIKGKISRDLLINNNYWLDEDIIKNLDIQKISGSGISCKRPNSHSYTYAKFSMKSFVNLFGSNISGAGISLFVNDHDIHLNNMIIDAWQCSSDELIKTNKEALLINGIREEEMSLTKIEVCKIIKRESINYVQRQIITNTKIANAIFKGEGVFEEPYTAQFVYIKGQLNEISAPKFTITTGSGRHKGTITIIIKPA